MDARSVEVKEINATEVDANKADVCVNFDDSFSSQMPLSCKDDLFSIRQSLCRICQSETGTLIRPCSCAGTMGKIHENCLNEWVLHSKKQCCEICKTEYAKSGNTFLPFREWKKPNVSSANWIEIIALCGLIYSFGYMLLLFNERRFLYRTFTDGIPLREPDVCRIRSWCTAAEKTTNHNNKQSNLNGQGAETMVVAVQYGEQT